MTESGHNQEKSHVADASGGLRRYKSLLYGVAAIALLAGIIAAQVVAIAAYAIYVCYRFMGRDYEAAVTSAAFIGFNVFPKQKLKVEFTHQLSLSRFYLKLKKLTFK